MNLEIGVAEGMRYLDDPHWIAADRTPRVVDDGRVDVILDASQPLPFRDNTFDEIYSGRCIGTYVTTRQSFEELVRVVKPGGRITLKMFEEDLWSYMSEVHSEEYVCRMRLLELEVTQSYPDDWVEGSEVMATWVKRRID